MSTDVSEKHVASIFRAEEYTKKETGMNQAGNSSFVLAGTIFVKKAKALKLLGSAYVT
jgi:hypothetical protein